MKIDRVKLEISIVAGILLTLVVSIFLGFALVGGFLNNSGYIIPPNNLESRKIQANIAGNNRKLSGYNSIVSVAQDGCWKMDTEQGEIDIYNNGLPSALPLCLTQAELDSYFIIVNVTGGYEPLNGTYITLWQKHVEVGKIEIVWNYYGSEPCYVDYWKATFKLTDGPIELDSNQWPVGADPYCSQCSTIPGKKVCLRYETDWQGCCECFQRFELIQIHQHDYINKSPTPHEGIIILIAS